MQLKIERNSTASTHHHCMVCEQDFEMKEAKVIVCSDRNYEYGDICSKCLRNGFDWIQKQLLRPSIFNDGKSESIKSL